jgi:CHASE3 domain sensor protein
MSKKIIESVENEGKVSSKDIKQMTNGLSASEKEKQEHSLKKQRRFQILMTNLMMMNRKW